MSKQYQLSNANAYKLYFYSSIVADKAEAGSDSTHGQGRSLSIAAFLKLSSFMGKCWLAVPAGMVPVESCFGNYW
jgi:hypothetical protein